MTDVGHLDPLTLAYELGEARSELARHHRDFKRISKMLDALPDAVTERTPPTVALITMAATLAQIRGVVG